MKFAQARDLVQRYGIAMLTAPGSGIVAVAIGSKSRGPIAGANKFCVTAFVPKKRSTKELQRRGLLSFKAVYAQTVGSSPPDPADLDVVESGSPFEPQAGLAVPVDQQGKYSGNPPALNAQKWFESLRVGIGITNPVESYPQTLSVGTIGFFIEDAAGQKYLVSNNHVIGRNNLAQHGEPVVQPGTLDLTGNERKLMPTQQQMVAVLKVASVSAVVPIDYMTPANIPVNRVDVAMASLTESDRDLSDLSRLTYGGSLLGVAEPFELSDTGAIQGPVRVYKVGRTTGYTEGVVTHIAGIATIDYDGRTAYFADQVIVQATSDNVGLFSDSGDSGSGILSNRHELVGLLFAGSQFQTLVNPISEVLYALETASGQKSLQVITA